MTENDKKKLEDECAKWEGLREKLNEALKNVTGTRDRLVKELADAVNGLTTPDFFNRLVGEDHEDHDGLAMLRIDEIRRVCAIIFTLKQVVSWMDGSDV